MRHGSSGTFAGARVLRVFVILCALVGLTLAPHHAPDCSRVAAGEATTSVFCESFHDSANESKGGRPDVECCIFCRFDAYGVAFVSGSALGAILFILHPDADRAWPENKRAPPPILADGHLTTWSATAPPASFA
jgi:hypothetical protein